MGGPLVLIGAIVWFFIALWTSCIAADKNHSAFGWFLFGLIYGPLALMVACAMSPAARDTARDTARDAWLGKMPAQTDSHSTYIGSALAAQRRLELGQQELTRDR